MILEQILCKLHPEKFVGSHISLLKYSNLIAGEKWSGNPTHPDFAVSLQIELQNKDSAMLQVA